MPGTNSSPISASAIHQAISFVTDEAKNAPFATMADRMQALSSGLKLCLELIESSDVDRECNNEHSQPILSVYDTGRMMRFAVATSGILAEMAEDHLTAINRNAKPAAKRDAHGS